ncbi:YggS family pyridoxal phosphate-dependent enzyme [bacterium]|nr:YggS family pyridoxal phosphate-dependent enzyme [bacterium]
MQNLENADYKRRIDTVLDRIASIRHRQIVRILAATKYGSADDTHRLIESGVDLIGENYVQSAEQKVAILHARGLHNFDTHLIGPLQSNKIKKAVSLFSCIQSIDRLSIIQELDTYGSKHQLVVNGMIQINTANEAQKSGFTFDEIMQCHRKLFAFSNIKIIGIMAVTPFSDTAEDVRPLFRTTFQLFSKLQQRYDSLQTLSMGMSGDFHVAIEEGSHQVRLGSVLFGR